MGYIPTPPPPDYALIDNLPSFTLQMMYDFGDPPPPVTPYQRWLWDSYGPAARDWFMVINAGFLFSLIAGLVIILYLIFR